MGRTTCSGDSCWPTPQANQFIRSPGRLAKGTFCSHLLPAAPVKFVCEALARPLRASKKPYGHTRPLSPGFWFFCQKRDPKKVRKAFRLPWNGTQLLSPPFAPSSPLDAFSGDAGSL
nr:hypothetical protein CFP56_41457 [Quercus suber]